MVAAPRTCSTVFLRMMQARGDFAVFHEPCLKVYAAKADPIVLYWFKDDAYQSWEEAKKDILEEAEERSVFVKDISFIVKGTVFEDEEFLMNENVHFVFLIRHPSTQILSYYKKYESPIELFSYFVGYKPLYECMEKIDKLSPNPWFIVNSEDLWEDPRLWSGKQVTMLRKSGMKTKRKNSFSNGTKM